MKRIELPATAGQIAELFGAEIIGDSSSVISRLDSLENAQTGVLSFLADRKFATSAQTAQGSVVLTNKELLPSVEGATFLVVADPKAVFAQVAQSLLPKCPWTGVSPLSVIDATAVLEDSVVVGPFCVVQKGAQIGKGTEVHSHVFIGAGVTIGEGCVLLPGAVLHPGVKVGNRVRIGSGAVLGSEGFGILPGGSETLNQDMPQVGGLVLEDEVRIGANSTVDRATLSQTRIEAGAKLDNLVHVGHNCRVARNVILCAQVGLGGSCVIEEEAILGGQVGLGHGVTVGARARMGGQSGSSTNVKGDETYFLTPATPMSLTTRIVRYQKRLPEFWRRLRALERAVLGEGQKDG